MTISPAQTRTKIYKQRLPVPRTLRAIRLERGWTLDHIAQLSGVPIATVSLIERGRMHPKPHEVRALSEALGIDLELITVLCAMELSP